MATKNDILQTMASEFAAAWSSGNAAETAGFFTSNAQISINRSEAIVGTEAIIGMVNGYQTQFPDMEMRCDLMRCAGQHAVFVWTVEGHHKDTKNHIVVVGWEEWEFDEFFKISKSRGWYDAEDLQRQIAGG